MDKKIYNQVIERAKGQCEVCGSRTGLEVHHIIQGRGKRKQNERIETLILLCYECHRGTNGVHGKNGKELNIKLKKQLQEYYFKQGYTEEETRKLMGGKLY